MKLKEFIKIYREDSELKYQPFLQRLHIFYCCVFTKLHGWEIRRGLRKKERDKSKRSES